MSCDVTSGLEVSTDTPVVEVGEEVEFEIELAAGSDGMVFSFEYSPYDQGKHRPIHPQD